MCLALCLTLPKSVCAVGVLRAVDCVLGLDLVLVAY